MDIDAIAKIRGTTRNEPPHKFEVSSDTIWSKTNGPSFKFSHVYKPEDTNETLFEHHIKPLIDRFLTGYNVSLLCLGEADSGKASALIGQAGSKLGIIPMSFSMVFNKLLKDIHTKNTFQATLKIFEVKGNHVKDLLSTSLTRSIDTTEILKSTSAFFIPGLTEINVQNAVQATSALKKAWNNRTDSEFLFENRNNLATIFVQLELNLKYRDHFLDETASKITFVNLASAENLVKILHENPVDSKDGVLALEQLLNQIIANKNVYPNYRLSTTTSLLEDEIGGNCRTCALLCLSPFPDSEILARLLVLLERLSQIRNYPAVNDVAVRGLILRWKNRLKSLEQQIQVSLGHGGATDDLTEGFVREKLRQTQTENIKLRDRAERLETRLAQLQARYSNVAHQKTDLTENMLEIEEDRLKVAKSLVDLEIRCQQIENSKESLRHQMTDQINTLQLELANSESKAEQYLSSVQQLKEMTEERASLANRIVNMQTEQDAMRKENKRLNVQNEELSMELVNALNSKSIMNRQTDNKKLIEAKGNIEEVRSANQMDPDLLVDRMRRHPSPKSENEHQRGLLSPFQKNQDNHAQQAFSVGDQSQDGINQMRNKYKIEQEAIREKSEKILLDLNRARDLAEQRLKLLSEAKSELILIKTDNKELKKQVNRAENRLAILSDEYRKRLNQYINDVAKTVDLQNCNDAKRLQDEAYRMLSEFNRSHQTREAQLSNAAANLRDERDLAKLRAEQILYEYVKLRQQILEKKLPGIDEGTPPEQLDLIEGIGLEAAHDRLLQEAIKRKEKRLRQKQSNLPTSDMKNFVVQNKIL